MKKILSSLAVLFAAALLIYSCNPVDEDQLPPSNPAQMTTVQATQLLQGSWYLHKVESIHGPTCAGGQNETPVVHTHDMQYAGFRIDFTQNSLGVDPLYNLPAYEMHYNGLGATANYNVLGYDNGYEEAQMYFSFLQYEFQSNDLWLNFPYLLLEGRVFNGGLIKTLTNEDLVLLSVECGMCYFKRSNQNSLPYNALNINGTFVLDNYKEVNSGVTDIDQPVLDGVTHTFTNTVLSSNMELKYKGESIDPNIFENPTLTLANYEEGSFYYEVSNTHLCTEGPSYLGGYVTKSYKIHQLNNTELVLRDITDCNTYSEYHLTKVN
jgi:hypothetical protein